jgi:RecA-family ATPase
MIERTEIECKIYEARARLSKAQPSLMGVVNKSDDRRSDKPKVEISQKSSPGSNPFPFTLARDIKVEPKEFLIEGFLGLREISTFYGAPDAGKSALITHAACCVAAGVEFCSRHVRQGGVLIIAAERGSVVKRRVKAWCLENGLPDIPVAIIDSAIDLRTSRLDADRVIATTKEIRMEFEQPLRWIIVDTLSRVLSGGDENSSKDMGAVIASIDRIHRETRAHCSLVHHVPHDRSDRMRGHGSLLAAVDNRSHTQKQ